MVFLLGETDFAVLASCDDQVMVFPVETQETFGSVSHVG